MNGRAPGYIGREQAGATLIELIVVVAVVLALVALFFGVSGKVREAADRARSIANLKSIGVAVTTYAADHQGLIPANLRGGRREQTVGTALDSSKPPARLYSKEWGISKEEKGYLDTPDVMYSPLNRRTISRIKGEFFQLTGIGDYRIGYLSYYLPAKDEREPALATSSKPPDGFYNDRMNGHPRAPLYSENFIETDEFYNAEHVDVICLDGAIRTYDRARLLALTKWRERYEVMAGMRN